jgi:hypothetical protein
MCAGVSSTAGIAGNQDSSQLQYHHHDQPFWQKKFHDRPFWQKKLDNRPFWPTTKALYNTKAD